MTHPILGPISTLDDLRVHLQWAIELEHSTLPPYLCALYSLDTERNQEAVEVVGSVIMEEMLHLSLAANLLNAVGGSPVLDAPHLLPDYPAPLPHGDRTIQVSLLPFGPEAIDLFMSIEKPSAAGAPPESDNYETIGQFYKAIESGLRTLTAELGESAVFVGDPARQIDRHFSYGGSGHVVAVRDLDTALEALTEIVEQGEGLADHGVWDEDHQMFHPERDEVAHFFRFQELKLGRQFRRGDTPASGPTGEPVSVDWDAVRPMQRNPRTTQQAPGSEIRLAQEEFNTTYCTLLAMLERAFNGEPPILNDAVDVMYALKSQAIDLMQMPTGDGRTVAGPAFEYVEPHARRTTS